MSSSGEITPDIEAAGRRRLFVVFLLILIVPLLIFGSVLVLRGLYLLAAVDYAVAALFGSFIWILGRLKNARILFRICLAVMIVLTLYWVNRGAIKGYASIWVLTLPPFAFYLLGRREGMVWTFLLSGGTAIQFLVPSLSLYGYVYDPSFVSRHLFALFLIILFTYNYESMRERYKLAMESEQRKLKDETTRLAEAKQDLETVNRLLNREMESRRSIEAELRKQQGRLEGIVAERTAELQRTNEELAASEARHRLITDNITDMIWSMDLNLQFTYISPSVSRLLGYTVDEALDLSVEKFDPPDSLAEVFSVFETQMELEKNGAEDPDRWVTLRIEHIRKDGTVIPVEITVSFLRNQDGEVIGIVGITRDIRERLKAEAEHKRIQEQLAQAQKMEAIGTLAGGIAHDFNNVLGGIIGSLQLVTRYLKDEPLKEREKVDRYMQLGMDSSLRSSKLIKQLLALSRKHEISLSPVDMNDCLEHVLEICQNSLPKSVTIDFVPSTEPMVVMGDMVQIEQVFLNLCINAAHAMTLMRPPDSRQGGVLEIRSAFVAKTLFADQVSSDGDWIRISVSDTGIGMDEETRLKIFEPFFSMKERGRGSGLGLSISYNIIRQHKGAIHVYTEPGKGSCFSVYIPSCSHADSRVPELQVSGKLVSGSGMILVIDDEPVMRRVARGTLETCGYQVITAGSGDDGIRLYREKPGEIAAVLLDLSMPGKSGLDVYAELAMVDPDIRVVLASGMLDSESQKSAKKIGIRKMVHKPYLAQELSVAVASVIAS